MQDIELISYMLVFALSVIWSAFAVERKSSMFSFFGSVTWFTLAMCHLSLAYTSSFIVLAYLFTGLGLAFMVHGFALVIMSMQIKKREKEWRV